MLRRQDERRGMDRRHGKGGNYGHVLCRDGEALGCQLRPVRHVSQSQSAIQYYVEQMRQTSLPTRRDYFYAHVTIAVGNGRRPSRKGTPTSWNHCVRLRKFMMIGLDKFPPNRERKDAKDKNVRRLLARTSGSGRWSVKEENTSAVCSKTSRSTSATPSKPETSVTNP